MQMRQSLKKEYAVIGNKSQLEKKASRRAMKWEYTIDNNPKCLSFKNNVHMICPG